MSRDTSIFIHLTQRSFCMKNCMCVGGTCVLPCNGVNKPLVPAILPRPTAQSRSSSRCSLAILTQIDIHSLSHKFNHDAPLT